MRRNGHIEHCLCRVYWFLLARTWFDTLQKKKTRSWQNCATSCVRFEFYDAHCTLHTFVDVFFDDVDRKSQEHVIDSFFHSFDFDKYLKCHCQSVAEAIVIQSFLFFSFLLLLSVETQKFMHSNSDCGRCIELAYVSRSKNVEIALKLKMKIETSAWALVTFVADR